MRRRFLWLALVVAAPAFGCGPDFPLALLDDRVGTLSDLPEGVFTIEAVRLAPPPEFAFKPAERAEWLWSQPPPTRDAIEREMFGADAERIEQVRRSADAATAYAMSEGLPEDARLYLAGAVAFAHERNDEALRRFESVLALPASERTHYGVWASYMVGRLEAGAGGDAAKAEAAFRNVRALVAAGAADPLGLAVDSFGEQAKLRLDGGDDAGAVSLYAEQAALGSRFGESSLYEVARAIVRDPARLERAIGQDPTEKLVTVFLSTRSGEVSETVLGGYLDAAERRGIDHLAGAGRLAALAYRAGRYDLAARFAARSVDGDAAWVRAKLALRSGDANAAAIAYAEASKAFPPDDIAKTGWLSWSDSPSAYCRVEGEAGTLSLARGEYVEALAHLFAASPTFWMDAAFVAERVLTLDELRAFVAREAPTPVTPVAPYVLTTESAQRSASLRALLARRLLRAERYDEAIAYFDDPNLKRFAREYATARRASDHGGRIERAMAGWTAAKLAREHGLELLGFELAPDDVFFDGNFRSYTTFGYGPTQDGYAPAPSDPAKLGIDAGPLAPERERVAATVAKPDLRYHYRYVAADLATRAADLVPNRSQAYAAMLCEATGWIRWRDANAARALYARYVANGPYVPWAADFGMQCEAPDFEGAAKRLRFERIRDTKQLARKSAPFAIAGLVAIGIGAFVLRRRKARTA
jgi:hypothetical protein